ncbi:MAG TPA: deoxyribodipyrimidine photo-lyase [Opitutaceae bacterium]
MTARPTIVWFRQDLRLQDNTALAEAVARGGPVIPVYILDDDGEGRWAAGGASRWWLHHSLAALQASLEARGSRLILARGGALAILRSLAASTGAGAVYWNRRYEPAVIARDSTVKTVLTSDGLEAKSFNGSLLFEPHTITNKQGRPFQVFTPYWRHCLTLPVPAPVALRAGPLPSPAKWPAGSTLASFGLLPSIPWDAGFSPVWTPGEEGARRRLKAFVAETITAYADDRNVPSVTGTSRLSPHLHFGEVGPRQVWAAVQGLSRESGVFPLNNGARVYLSEIGWREFSHHLVFHFPSTPERPLRPEFEAFPWASDPKGLRLRAWQRGRTGYPIVDAGMRELWTTGWMHNRVRMIVASFLVKHLRLNWTHGATWFWDTLVDADLAANTLGWQWSAGCGADAAPYFRIFAPVLQGEKFDPKGEYVRKWVPEIARLPDKFLHAPWTAPANVLEYAGVDLGRTYPEPIVDHATARAEALAAFKQLRGARPDADGAGE